ncbi:MAG: glycosyltransferase, partial [Chitinophagaceae bacterium]
MLLKEKPITNYLLDKPSLFWTPEYLEISAWTEHIPFAFWIIEVLKPKITVELGVHTGTSYFSFCQAVKRLNMDAVCYGVDTWKGDEHSGLYEEEVYSKVLDYNNEKYSEFSTLIRSSFDEAKDYFIDGSIDLLHIDGLHTYDAVRHDYENWFPKLSADAIVVFHDINVRERNFGVFRLWEELKQQYRSFQFDFGHGLGILAIGEVAGELEILLDTHRNDEYYIFLRNLFSERGRSFKNKFDASFLIKQERENLETQRKNLSQITERYKMLESNNNLLQESNTALEISNQIHQASLTELKEKLNLANSTYNQITKELEDQKNKMDELNFLIQKQSQIIRWYKNTYEDRNIIGVLKEKLTFRLKKKINPAKAETLNNLMPGYHRKNRYTVNPAKDILFLPDSHEYASYGPDPYFTVDLVKKKLNAGWYWLSIDIVEVKGMLIAPKLYYDCGRGFNEEDVWNLPEISNGKIVSLIKFPGHIHGFRFDPTINECTFKLHDFDLKALSTIQAFNRAISKYKEINYPQKSYLNIYKEFLGDFIKTGKSGIRKKIWDSITYRKDNSLNEYWAWCSLYDTISPGQKKRIEFLADQLSYQPVFSIIMPVFNAPLNLLKMAIDSVVNQAYKNWELCIADDKSTNEDVKKMLIECQQEDPRIKVVLRETNGHISKASNSALAIATGDYVVLLDQDDELPVHCLFMVAETLNKNRNLGIIYSDEDKIDEMGNRFDPYFKTDWNKDLFYGQNM